MNQNPKISVIMPVYNVKEEYLRQSINSILNQLYTDFEFIIINDSSTNNSEDIILSYKDERIKYILNKSRGGQSKSRNLALKIAKGDYIFFIDADDWIDIRTFKRLINQAEKQNCDILIFGVNSIDPETGDLYRWTNDEPILKLKDTCVSSKDSIIINNLFEITQCCWGKLYKRDFLIQNNLFFVENLIFEDTELYYRYILKADKIGAYNDYFYFYRYLAENSTMASGDERFFDWFKVTNLREKTLKEYNLFEKFKLELYTNNIIKINYLYNDILMPQYKEKFKQLVKDDFKKMKLTEQEINQLKNYTEIPNFSDEFIKYLNILND